MSELFYHPLTISIAFSGLNKRSFIKQLFCLHKLNCLLNYVVTVRENTNVAWFHSILIHREILHGQLYMYYCLKLGGRGQIMENIADTCNQT